MIQGWLGGLAQGVLLWVIGNTFLLFAGAPIAVLIGSLQFRFSDFVVRLFVLALLCGIAGSKRPRFASTRGFLTFLVFMAVDWFSYLSLPYPALIDWKHEPFVFLSIALSGGFLLCLSCGWLGARMALQDMRSWWQEEWEEFRDSIGLSPRIQPAVQEHDD
jgi:hypothetical protein